MFVHHPVGEDEVIRTNMALAKEKIYTVEDLESFPENVRAELIDGQIFYFASPTLRHQRLTMQLGFSLHEYIRNNKGTCEVLVSPFAVRLNEDDKTEVQPDILVICDPGKLQEDACYGAPDLIIEVASKSTSRRDYGLKLLKYRTAGVREYWVVDPMKEIVMVWFFEDESQNDCYTFEDEIPFRLFPDVKVRLADVEFPA